MIMPGPARGHIDLERDAAAQTLAGRDSGGLRSFRHLRIPVLTSEARSYSSPFCGEGRPQRSGGRVGGDCEPSFAQRKRSNPWLGIARSKMDCFVASPSHDGEKPATTTASSPGVAQLDTSW